MKKNVYLALFSAALFMGFNVYGQSDMVIKIDGIPGESKISGHVGEITIFSFSDGISSCIPNTSTTSTSKTTCKAVASGFNFMTQFDKATIPLFTASASAKVIPFADVTTIKSGTTLEFYKIHFENITVVSVQESGSSGGDTRPTVSVSLSFSRIAWQYTIQSTTGGEDEKVTGGWDFVLGKPFSFTFQ